MHNKTTSQPVEVRDPQEIDKEHRFLERVPTCTHSGCKSSPRWVRPHSASDMYGIGLTKLYQLIKDGRLETRKVDKMRLISVISLETLGQ